MSIYTIRKYEMINATLYSFEVLPFDTTPEIKMGRDGNIEKVSGLQGGEYVEYTANRYYELSNKPKGFDYKGEYLPYIATLKEDLPGSCKGLKPKVYKHCQLMTEKHGGYLQFWHEKSKQVLRIAIHSHTYEPEIKSAY